MKDTKKIIMKKIQEIKIIIAISTLISLTCCSMAQPVFANSVEALGLQSPVFNFSSFIQTVATGLFATCVVGVWRMSGQLTAMNARLTSAVSYIDQRLNDQHQRLLYQERNMT